MFLDTKFDFQEYLKYIFSKINKIIVLLWKLHHILPRSSALTIYHFLTYQYCVEEGSEIYHY